MIVQENLKIPPFLMTRGFDPCTPRFEVWCSTNCATWACELVMSLSSYSALISTDSYRILHTVIQQFPTQFPTVPKGSQQFPTVRTSWKRRNFTLGIKWPVCEIDGFVIALSLLENPFSSSSRSLFTFVCSLLRSSSDEKFTTSKAKAKNMLNISLWLRHGTRYIMTETWYITKHGNRFVSHTRRISIFNQIQPRHFLDVSWRYE